MNEKTKLEWFGPTLLLFDEKWHAFWRANTPLGEFIAERQIEGVANFRLALGGEFLTNLKTFDETVAFVNKYLMRFRDDLDKPSL